MAAIRQSLLGRDGLLSDRLQVRSGEDADEHMARDGRRADILLYHNIRWKAVHEEQAGIQIERLVHDT